MRLLTGSITTILAGLLLSVCCSSPSDAQPWPREQGRLFTTTYASIYRTTERTTSSGNVVPMGGDGAFISSSSGLYFEYGVTPRWTVHGTLNGAYLIFQNQTSRSARLTFGDQRLGIRYAPYAQTWAVSAGLLGTVPWLYDLEKRPLPGFGQHSLQPTVTIGRGIQFGSIGGWSLLKGGYRHYFGSATPQIRGQLLGGVHFSRRWGLMARLDGTIAAETGSFQIGQQTSNPAVRSGYSVLKLTVSALYEYSPRATIQLSASREIWGQNSGFGGGLMGGLWYQY